jgi:16S rRNA processing protein RimM
VTTSLIQIGRIVNRHGVRGELRVLPHNPESTALDLLPEVVIETSDGRIDNRRVLSARRHKRFVLVRLDGVGTADEAEAMIGRTVSLHAADLPPAGAGEIYYHELVGCAVVTEAGEELGRVCEVFATGSNDVCVVRQGETEHLIPLIADVVVELSTERRQLVIRPLPGLLDA